MSGKRGGRRPRRRSTKGFLSRMRDAPSRASKRKTGPVRKVVEWTLGIAAAVVILGSVALLGARFLFPDMGAEIREATVEIDEVVSAEDSGIGIEVPIVTVEDGPTMLRRPPEGGGRVAAGDRVHVTYEYKPLSNAVVVQRWRIEERATADDSATGDAGPGPPAADEGTGGDG